MTHALSAAAMSSASMDDLPDSAFAYIEPGGSKDSEGKTVPRSLRHFPIHDEAHVRNALSRAPQSPFGDKAMPKIRAACKKFGIRWSGMDSKVYAAAGSTGEMLGVELARPGTWHLASGKRTFTADNLKDAADFFAATGQTRIPLGFGHSDSRFDGDPAFGWVSNIRYAEDAKGPVLLGDLVDMDEWVAAAAPRRWPNRSIEGFANLDWNGRTYSLALTRLALLGSTPPAMPNLRSLADMRAAVAAAAADSAAEFITASAPSDVDPQDSASEAVVPPSEAKEAGMDPAKIRERLGLDDDVSDDDVMEALAYAGFVPQPDKPAEPAPVAASAPKAELIAASGMITIDASAWNEREERIKRLEAQEDRRRAEERDQIIAKAVVDGKFAPARTAHWVRLWNADPEGARTILDGLAKNVVPVMASGYAGGDGLDVDADYAALYGAPDARKAG
jgi:hypothetical protein